MSFKTICTFERSNEVLPRIQFCSQAIAFSENEWDRPEAGEFFLRLQDLAIDRAFLFAPSQFSSTLLACFVSNFDLGV